MKEGQPLYLIRAKGPAPSKSRKKFVETVKAEFKKRDYPTFGFPYIQIYGDICEYVTEKEVKKQDISNGNVTDPDDESKSQSLEDFILGNYPEIAALVLWDIPENCHYIENLQRIMNNGSCEVISVDLREM